jgi:hypothetical protein
VGYLPSSHHRGCCQLITIIKPLQPAQQGIFGGFFDRFIVWSDGQGPILQAYPFCENSAPEKKKKQFLRNVDHLVSFQPPDQFSRFAGKHWAKDDLKFKEKLKRN